MCRSKEKEKNVVVLCSRSPQSASQGLDDRAPSLSKGLDDRNPSLSQGLKLELYSAMLHTL